MGKYLFTLKAVLLLWLSSEGLCYTCQPPTLWQKVANNVCQYPSFFHCLRDDKSNDYAIMCLQPIENPAGSSIVYDTSLNAERCQKERYQPKPYWSNALNQCVFKKSLCSEEGQVIYDNGTETIDRTCRCDYRKGYAFITPPKHTCYCVPSEEECGCYIKRCPNSSYVMTSEYTCMIGHSEEASLCQNFPPDSGPPTQNSKETIQRVRTYDLGTYNIKKDVKRSCATGAIAFITIVAIVASIGGILWEDNVRTCIEIATGGEYAEQVNTIKRLTQKEIKYLKLQNVFFNTKSFHQAMDALDQHNIVVIKGRYGTGKSTIALQLASDFAERNFEPYKFDALSIDLLNYLMKTKQNRVIILENILGDVFQRDVKLMEWKKVISFFPIFTNTKLIITTYFVNQDLRQALAQHIDTSQATFLDLDDNTSLDLEDKKLMLHNYYTKHSRLCTDNIDIIAHCNPVVGFPLMCSLFCSDDINFTMGVTYFLQPPTALVEQVETLKVLGIDADSEAIKYSVLVYVSLNKTNVVNVDKDHVNMEVFKTIYKQVYTKDYLSDVSFILNSASRFRVIYLDVNESGDCVFINPAIRQAVLISYGKIDPKLVIANAPLEDLLIIIRPENYKSFPKESILQISTKNNSDLYETFAQRIAAECIQTPGVAEKVGLYLYEYTVKRHDFKLLEFVLDELKIEAKKSKDTQYIPSLITVFQEITNHSTSCLPMSLPPIDFRLTWEIICAAQNRKEDIVLHLFENSKATYTVNDVIFAVADEYDNTLLHYFVVWGYNSGVLFLENIKKSTDLKKNKFGFSAIHFAAVLARPVYLRMLLKINKSTEESKLSKLAIKFLNKIRKNETLTANQIAFLNISSLVKEGESRQGQNVAINEQNYVNINKHITSNVMFGQQIEYDSAIKVVEEFYKQVLIATSK